MEFDRKVFHKWLHRYSIAVEAASKMFDVGESVSNALTTLAMTNEKMAKEAYTQSLEVFSSPMLFPSQRINRFALNARRAVETNIVPVICSKVADHPMLALMGAFDKKKQEREQRKTMDPAEIFRKEFESESDEGFPSVSEMAGNLELVEAGVMIPRDYAIRFRDDPLWTFSQVMFSAKQVNDYVFNQIDINGLAAEDENGNSWPGADALHAEVYVALAKFGYDYPVKGTLADLLRDYPRGYDSLPEDKRIEPTEAFVGDYRRMEEKTNLWSGVLKSADKFIRKS